MTIKALLIGSAAGIMAVTGANAADAIIADAEPVDYVRVCDAYGSGFFYIPGTETCLQLSGYVRYDINFDEDGWSKNARGVLNIDVREDTEYGTLRGFIALQGNSGAEVSAVDTDALIDAATEDEIRDAISNSGNNVIVDQAFMSLGGFYAGLRYDYFDGNGIGGENDQSASAQVNAVGYDFSGEGFSAGIMLVDDADDGADFTPNVEGFVSASMGPADITIVAGYDNNTENGLVEATASFAVAEGVSFGILGLYATGETFAWDSATWTVAASINATLTDTVAISVGGQYLDGLGFSDDDTRYTIGANLDWTPVSNFLVRGSVQYGSEEIGGVESSSTTGYVRFQRSF